MGSAVAIAPSYGFQPGLRPVIRAARASLLLLLGVIYAGFLQFFIQVSPVLLYGTYAVIIGCVTVCLFFDWQASRNFESVAPYLIWTLGYFLWGMLALSHESAVISEGVKMYIKNLLIIGALAFALDRGSLRPFSQILQISAVGNFLLCIYEAANPDLIAQIATTREAGATAFDVLRPAGLWSNPDEASSAYIFSLLMTRWAGGRLAWFGGVAAVGGIFLGASRTGALLLLICGVSYAVYWLRRNRIDTARLALFSGALMLVVGGGFAAMKLSGFDPADNWQIGRMLDITESRHGYGEASRVHIAIESIRTALNGPWCGFGLFTFQFHAQPEIPTIVDPPAHNIYIAVFGEAGLPVGISYLVILGLGLRRVFATPMHSTDRLPVLLMWICYLLIGLTWHNEFTAFSGMLYVALLWRVPAALKNSPEPRDSLHGEAGIA